VTALIEYSMSSLGALTISSMAVNTACTGPVPTAALTTFSPFGSLSLTVAVGMPFEPQVT